MNDDQEMLDLVDENDQVIGAMERGELYRQKLHNYRVVHAFLKNDMGEIWIPKRTAHKKLYPNALDYGIAGHVSSGESYDEALRKEAREELNIDIDRESWRLLGKMTPKDGAHCFQAVYEVMYNQEPVFNPEDFTGGEWLRPEEVVRRIRSGVPAKTDVVTTIERYYLNEG